MSAPHGPAVEVRVALTGIDPGEDLRRAVVVEVERRLDELLSVLGVPGIAAATVESSPPGAARPVRLEVEGRACRFPAELAGLVLGEVLGSPAAVAAGATDPVPQLRGLAERAASGDEGARESFVSAVAGLCWAAVARRPSVLLGTAGVQQLLDELPCDHPRADWSADLLRGVLDLGLSLADRATVADSLEAATTRRAAGEALVDALRPPALRLQVAPDLLQTLTSDEGGRELVPYLREQLFEELGIALPPLRFEPSPQLRPGRFVLVVNHVPTTPRLALTPTQRLVNDTAERVTALAPGRLGSPIPTLNPATGAPAAIVELPDGDASFLDGLVTWNTWGHVVLCLAAELRQHAWRLISRRTLTDRLDLLRPAWPAQTEAALETVGLDRLTGLLRGLLREQVSVHNLPWILDVVLDVADERGSGSDPLDDPELLRWVRVGLGLAVTSGVSRGTETLIAYLLDPVMEEEVRRSANGALAAAEERLVVALAQEQSALPPGVQTPHVLTQGDVRCAVRAALWTEFPRINVLSHEEVPANWNVQPVARLIAPTAG